MKWHHIENAKAYCRTSNPIKPLWMAWVLWCVAVVRFFNLFFWKPFREANGLKAYARCCGFFLQVIFQKAYLCFPVRMAKPVGLGDDVAIRTESQTSPLISIVITTFNVESYIEECLESVLTQPFREVELIIVDDASTDSTYALLERYRERFPHYIRLVQHKENQGHPSVGRNQAMRLARAPYVAFVDGDDFLLPDALWLCWERIKRYQPDVVYTGFSFFEDGSRRQQFSKPFSPQRHQENGSHCFNARTANAFFWSVMYNAACFKIYRRDFLLHYGLSFEPMYLEDVGFSMKSYLAAERTLCIPEILYGVRLNRRQGLNGNRSQRQAMEQALDGLKNVQSVYTFCEYYHCWDEAVREKAYYKFHSIIHRLLLPRYVKQEGEALFFEHLCQLYETIGMQHRTLVEFSSQEKREVAAIVERNMERYQAEKMLSSLNLYALVRFAYSLWSASFSQKD